jgi:hypothetical protein
MNPPGLLPLENPQPLHIPTIQDVRRERVQPPLTLLGVQHVVCEGECEEAEPPESVTPRKLCDIPCQRRGRLAMMR